MEHVMVITSQELEEEIYIRVPEFLAGLELQ